jgi:hypothetical protein
MKRETENRVYYTIAVLCMLGMAFLQGQQVTHDLSWANDPDFDRDASFVQGALDGHFGKDPSYAGQWLWYNPLLFLIETFLVRITGMSPHLIVTRAGPYLNLLGPVAFVLMVGYLFDRRIALASLLSFLFLSSGQLLGWAGATYSPWLYPVCFAQFLFYLNIILCYKAFTSGRLGWFLLLGVCAGLSFEGHAAPTVLIILIIGSLQINNLYLAAKNKDAAGLSRSAWQCLILVIGFLLTASLLLYYIFGKYHLKLINRATFEYTEGVFIVKNFRELIKQNLTLPFCIAVIGAIWFYRKCRQPLLRKMMTGWLAWTLIMYTYATLVSGLDRTRQIRLPGTVPSFHYFFYFKALQSIFFGYGIFQLWRSFFFWAQNRWKFLQRFHRARHWAWIAALLICAFLYYPFYQKREDFADLRDKALMKESDHNKIELYHYILHNVGSDQVILCEKEPSLFPVMTTGRKMVSTAFTFSNPYLDFNKRESDRNEMLSWFKTGTPGWAEKTLKDYGVKYVLLFTQDTLFAASVQTAGAVLRFQNSSYSLFELGNPPQKLVPNREGKKPAI